MSVMNEIETIKNDRSLLSKHMELFKRNSQAKMEIAHRQIYNDLGASIKTLLNVVQFVSKEDQLLTFRTSQTNRTSHHTESLAASLKALKESAKSGLDMVEGIHARHHDLNEELQGLRTRSINARKKAAQELDEIKSELVKANSAASVACKKQEETKRRMEVLDADMEEKKSNRNVMRAARAATWGASVFIHPLALVAGALEIKAAKMRAERTQLEEQRAIFTAVHKASSKQVLQLQLSIESRQSDLNSANATLTSTEQDVATFAPLETEMQHRIQMYQELTSSMDDFSFLTHSASQQGEDILVLGLDAERLGNLADALGTVLQKMSCEVGRTIMGKAEML